MNRSLKLKRTRSLFLLSTLSALFLAAPNVFAQDSLATQTAAAGEHLQIAIQADEEKRPRYTFDGARPKESWAFATDNDVLAPGKRDRDYTYGVNWAYSGDSARDAAISLQQPLASLNSLVDMLPEASATQDQFSHEFGFFGFTPDGLKFNADDRPYASLIYFSSSREQLDQANNIAWKSSLTLGVLGLDLVGNVQNQIHAGLGSNKAEDWNTQISDGGELTGRYTIARQQYLEGWSDSFEVKSTVQASVGYLTETSWSLSIREGNVNSPWASFNPELISYGEKSTYTSNAEATNENYFWAGVTVKARLYNVFLQGQFRDSTQTYSANELRPLIAEAWAGYTFAFKSGHRISYVLRGQTSEIKAGDGDRHLLWGGLIISKSI